MANWPTIIVEAAWASNPYDGAQTWTDITAAATVKRFRGAKLRRGRRRQLDRFEAGEMQVHLRNDDRVFDPRNTGSPYSPNIDADKQLRLSAVWASTTYRLSTAFIESFKPDWSGIADAEMVITATDALGFLADKKISNARYAATISALSPVAFYRLGDPIGSGTAADSSGHGWTGTINGKVTLGVTGALPADIDTAMTFATPGWIDAGTGPALAGAHTFTVECWVKTTSSAIQQVVSIDETLTSSIRGDFWIFTDGGHAEMSFIDAVSNQYILTGSKLINDDVWHHIVAVVSGTSWKLYVDGVLDGQQTNPTITIGTGLHLYIGGTNLPDAQFDGSIDEVAVYTAALSAAQVLTNYQTGAGAFLTQTPGARIAAVLDAVGWPSTTRALDTGQTTALQPFPTASLTETYAIDAIALVAASESGSVFADGAGNVVFADRGRMLRTPYNTSQVTAGDAAQPSSELPYPPGAPQPGYDRVDVANEVRVQRVDGAVQTATDGTSRYMARTLDRSSPQLLLTTDSEALDVANYLLSRRKNADWHVDEITINPLVDPRWWPHVLGRELGDLITLIRRPPGGGVALTLPCRIEGIDHTINPPNTWITKWQLSAADVENYFILDSATNGKLDTSLLFY